MLEKSSNLCKKNSSFQANCQSEQFQNILRIINFENDWTWHKNIIFCQWVNLTVYSLWKIMAWIFPSYSFLCHFLLQFSVINFCGFQYHPIKFVIACAKTELSQFQLVKVCRKSNQNFQIQIYLTKPYNKFFSHDYSSNCWEIFIVFKQLCLRYRDLLSRLVLLFLAQHISGLSVLTLEQ